MAISGWGKARHHTPEKRFYWGRTLRNQNGCFRHALWNVMNADCQCREQSLVESVFSNKAHADAAAFADGMGRLKNGRDRRRENRSEHERERDGPYDHVYHVPTAFLPT